MYGQPPSPNAFQKPKTVTFKFYQKNFDRSGELKDNHDNVIYKFRDVGEDHTFGFIKTYPLQIIRASDDTLVASIEWKSDAKKTTVDKLVDAVVGPVRIAKGVMDDDLKRKLPDGSAFEWDGTFAAGESFKLYDYRIPQPYSLQPAIVAEWKEGGYAAGKMSTLEVLHDALSVPKFLDYLAVTCIWLEELMDDIVEETEERARRRGRSRKAANKLGEGIGQDIANDIGN